MKRIATVLLLLALAGVAPGQTTDSTRVAAATTSDTMPSTGILVTVPIPKATSPTLTTTTIALPPPSDVSDPTIAGNPPAIVADSDVLGYIFKPPLSIPDANHLLGSCITTLELSQRGLHELNREKTARKIELVINYIDLLDKRYSTLWDYSWIEIDSHKVSKEEEQPPLGDTDIFRPRSPLNNVSAIGIEVTRADIENLKIEIWDEQSLRAKLEFERIQHDLPLKTVSFLNSPDIKLVKAIASAKVAGSAPAARLIIYAGITARPEYAKYANLKLSMAVQLVKDKKDAESIQALRVAAHHLLNFQKQQNL